MNWNEDNKSFDDEAIPDPFLETIKKYLFSDYLPTDIFEPGVVFMSTQEVWNMLQRLYPNVILYSPADVANWLNEKGFKFTDQGQMRYEWMLKPKVVT